MVAKSPTQVSQVVAWPVEAAARPAACSNPSASAVDIRALRSGNRWRRMPPLPLVPDDMPGLLPDGAGTAMKTVICLSC